MPRVIIEDLEWDEENEAHLDRHINPDIVHEMIERGDWIQVRNKTLHPREYVRLIGFEQGVSMLTVVLAPTNFVGVWRPVTAFWSSKKEADLYHERKRNRFDR